MKSVLYTYDMEPITVIDLPIQVHKLQYRVYRVPVFEPVSFCHPDENRQIQQSITRIVDVRIEPFYRSGKEYPFFFVDEQQLVDALDLQSVPLSGQKKEFEDKYKEGFMAGLMSIFA